MSRNEKKISFSFSKVKKAQTFSTAPDKISGKNVELVDCFDGDIGFMYKGQISSLDRSDGLQKELVIPLVTSKSQNNTKTIQKNKDELNVVKKTDSDSFIGVKTDAAIEDDVAVAAILRDIKESETNKSSVIIENELSVNPTIQDKTEGFIDYEKIPVTDFGLAMLRGMGWKPDSGIGKDPRRVSTVSPKMRPRGLGLGANYDSEKIRTQKEKKVRL